MATLVVGGDGNIDVLGGRVTVAEGLQLLAHVQFLTDPQFGTYNDGDVDVGGLLDGLGVGAGVGDDDQAGLLERAGDVVGEVTGGEATGNGDGTGVGGELQDGTLAVGTGRDDTDCALLAIGLWSALLLLLLLRARAWSGLVWRISRRLRLRLRLRPRSQPQPQSPGASYCRPGCRWRR